MNDFYRFRICRDEILWILRTLFPELPVHQELRAPSGLLRTPDLTWWRRAWLLDFSLGHGSLVKFRQSLFAIHVKAQYWFVSSFMLLNL